MIFFGGGDLRAHGRCTGLKVVISCFYEGTSYALDKTILLSDVSFSLMYSITDWRTDRQIALSCQLQPILLRPVRSVQTWLTTKSKILNLYKSYYICSMTSSFCRAYEKYLTDKRVTYFGVRRTRILLLHWFPSSTRMTLRGVVYGDCDRSSCAVGNQMHTAAQCFQHRTQTRQIGPIL